MIIVGSIIGQKKNETNLPVWIKGVAGRRGSRRQERGSRRQEGKSPAGGEVADKRESPAGVLRRAGVAGGSIAQSRSGRRKEWTEEWWPAIVQLCCSTSLYDFDF
ncbi:hypothetical protein L1887_05057 [Cichorium endivia]|nr:hypothetical protein L1887_05057 [Cichorium endivia]